MEKAGVLEGVRARKRGKRHGQGHFHKLVGIGIALVGFFWLAKQAGWIPVEEGGSPVFWPIVAIAIGLAIIYRAGKRREEKRRREGRLSPRAIGAWAYEIICRSTS